MRPASKCTGSHPPKKDTDNAALEKRLWDAADQFRANSGLKSQEYSAPVPRARSSNSPSRTCSIRRPQPTPARFTRKKCSALFEHIYESYPERDAGVYSVAE